MAAIVCHGLQSHLESQHTESIALKLMLSSSKPSPPQLLDLAFKSCLWDSNPTTKPQIEENNNSTPSNTNSWSFLEALSNMKKEPSEDQTPYVHPQQKRSSLRLSQKSLELCTENLGNESGSDSDESSIDMLSSVNGNSGTREQRQPRPLSTAKTQNFPPPLTTIRGSESLRMRPHREDGRLVIEVTKVPPTPSCFQAERSHGRLRLCFLTNHTPSFDPQEEDDDVEESDALANEKELENEIIGQVKDSDTNKEEVEEQTEQETKEEEEEEERVACGCLESDVMMIPKRCKEDGDPENSEILNWC